MKLSISPLTNDFDSIYLQNMWILSKILTVLFPPQCLFCKKENVSLCMECIYACSKAVETPHKWIYTTYSYKNASIKKCMQLIKYYHRKDLIEPIVKSTPNHSLFDFIKNKEKIEKAGGSIK